MNNYSLLFSYTYFYILIRVIISKINTLCKIKKGKYVNVDGCIVKKYVEDHIISGEYRTQTHYIIEYYVNNERYEIDYTRTFYTRKLDVGYTFQLMYDKDNPKKYYVKSFLNNYFIIILFIIYSIVFIIRELK